MAEADQRPLATAQLVEKTPEPEPATEPENQPEPIVYPEPSASDETMILPEPVELPSSKEPVSIETPEVPERVSLDDLATPLSSAETVVSDTEELAGWEERIRTAIDASSSEEESTEADDDSATVPVVGLGSTLLEDSPQFDFQMDPPDETPIEHEPVSPEDLTKTAEWFESTSTENVDELEVPADERTTPTDVPNSDDVATPVATTPSPTKQRKKTNSLARLATVFLLFAIVGTLLGQYALLWLRGPSADYLGLAQVLPSSALPGASSQILAPQISANEQLVAAVPEHGEDEADPPARELLAEDTQTEDNPIADLLRDDAVTPATAELPVEPANRALPLLPSTGVTPGEFSALLSEAQQAVPGFLAGEISSREAKRIKGQAYMAFCRLAERWDFADANPAQLDDAAAKRLFENLATQPAGRSALAFIGQRWWQHDGRPHQGCVLVGRVQSASAQGGATLYELALENSDAGIVVPVVAANGNFQQGDTLAVVGNIVKNPQQVVPQFSLDLPQAVVARYVVGL